MNTRIVKTNRFSNEEGQTISHFTRSRTMKQIITTRIAARPAKRILIIMVCAGLLVFGQVRAFLPRPTL